MGSVRHSTTSTPQGLYDVSADQLAPLGTVLEIGDGREFVYARVGAVAAVQGRLYAGPALIAGHGQTGRALDTPLIGERVVTITPATTEVLENQYAEGFFVIVNDTGGIAGAGTCYKISGHGAAAIGVAVAITLFDQLWETITAGSAGALIQHPCNLVVITQGPVVTPVIGVAVRDMAINDYGWFQRKGIAGILQTAAIVEGNIVSTDDAVAGSIGPETAGGGAEDEVQIGTAISDTATADIGVVNMSL